MTPSSSRSTISCGRSGTLPRDRITSAAWSRSNPTTDLASASVHCPPIGARRARARTRSSTARCRSACRRGPTGRPQGSGSRTGRGRTHQFSWTSSISVPKLPLGWMNATVVPRLPGPRCLIDQRGAGGPHRLEGLAAVGDAVADVVEPLAPLLDRLGDRRVVAGRRQQLDVAVGHLEQRLFDAVGLDHLAVVDGGAEGPWRSSRWPLPGRAPRWRRGRSRSRACRPVSQLESPNGAAQQSWAAGIRRPIV